MAKVKKGQEKLDVIFRANMARLRRERGLSYRALAEEAGISAPYAHQVEAGLREPSLETVAKIARTLGVRASTMLEAS